MGENFRALIITVGRQKQPVEVSIVEHQPQGVIFLATKDTLRSVGELIEEYKGQFLADVKIINSKLALIQVLSGLCAGST